MSDLVELGKILRTQRETRALSAAAVAKAAGISATYLSFLENGRNPKTGKPSRASMEVLVRLADAVGLSPNVLLSLAGYPSIRDREGITSSSESPEESGQRLATLSGAHSGIPAEMLEPKHVIRDSVLGDIVLTSLEKAIVDSPSFQRLRGLRQIGNGDLVYPGATHTRFAHALGTLKMAEDVLHRTFLTEGSPSLDSSKPHDQSSNKVVRGVSELESLTRLAALLHDLSHLPFEHVLADFVPPTVERRTKALRTLFFDDLRSQLPTGTAATLIKSLDAILNPRNHPSDETDMLSLPAQVIRGPLSACWLDRLQRDAYYTGVAPPNPHRILSYLFIARPEEYPAVSNATLAIRNRGSHIRADLLSEFAGLLQQDYLLQERVLFHPAKTAADAMLSNAVRCWAEAHDLDKQALFNAIPSGGDDAFLEFLANQDEPPLRSSTAVIARQIQRRQLHRLVYRYRPRLQETIHEERDELEQTIRSVVSDEHRVAIAVTACAPQRPRLFDTFLATDDKTLIPLSALSDAHLIRAFYNEYSKLSEVAVYVEDKGLSSSSLDFLSALLNERTSSVERTLIGNNTVFEKTDSPLKLRD